MGSVAPAEFELGEGTPADINEIIRVLVTAIASDEMVRYTFGDVSPEEFYKWFCAYFGTRYAMNDMSCFTMTEKSTGKIAAYVAVQFPWSIKPLSEEEMVENSKYDPYDIPYSPKGFKLDGWVELYGMLNGSHDLGYDPMRDFQLTFEDNSATMVLPEYQRMGLAKKLTKHCNDIQDQYKANRYVSARFTSMNMFRGLGFKDIGVYDPHAERWGKGYDVEKAKYALLCRASQLTV